MTVLPFLPVFLTGFDSSVFLLQVNITGGRASKTPEQADSAFWGAPAYPSSYWFSLILSLLDMFIIGTIVL